MSSNNSSKPPARRAAFSREPRGANQQQGSNKKNQAKLVRIDAKFIESMKKAQVQPDLSTVLTTTGSRLTLELSANGAMTMEARTPTGTVLADEADIRRILSLNSSFTKERKEAAKAELGPAVLSNMAAIVEIVESESRSIKTLPKQYVEVYRSVATGTQFLNKNLVLLNGLNLHGSELACKTLLIGFCHRALDAIGKFLIHRAEVQEHETPQKLNYYIRSAKCPAYFFNKLSTELINSSTPDFNIISLVWPTDPSKGFYLTYREIVEQKMQNFCGDLTSSWSIIDLLLQDDSLRVFLNTSKMEDLTAFDDATKLGSKVAGVPFMVPIAAEFFRPSSFFGFLAKNGCRGIQWKAGSTLTPQDNLKFLGTVAKRVQYFSVTNPTAWVESMGIAFPEFHYDKTRLEEDIFVQLKRWSIQPNVLHTWHLVQNMPSWTKDLKCPINVAKMDKDTTAIVRSLIKSVLSPGPGTEADKVLSALIGQMEKFGYAPTSFGPGMTLDEIKRRALILKQDQPKVRKILEGKFQIPKNLLGQKKKDERLEKNAGMVERTILSPEAKAVVRSIKASSMEMLAKRMNAWFRQFLRVETQVAVANVLAARLESFMLTPVSLSKEERFAFIGTDLPYDDVEEEEEAESEDDDTASGGRSKPENPDDNI